MQGLVIVQVRICQIFLYFTNERLCQRGKFKRFNKGCIERNWNCKDGTPKIFAESIYQFMYGMMKADISCCLDVYISNVLLKVCKCLSLSFGHRLLNCNFFSLLFVTYHGLHQTMNPILSDKIHICGCILVLYFRSLYFLTKSTRDSSSKFSSHMYMQCGSIGSCFTCI